MATKPTPRNPLLDAIDFDAFEWMMAQAPHMAAAIQKELEAGKSPEQIRYIVQSAVGPDRLGLALRCEQAARYMSNGTQE